MGFSTFIEINNDYELDDKFIDLLRESIHSGRNKMGNEVISFRCLHRDSKDIVRIRKLLSQDKE